MCIICYKPAGKDMPSDEDIKYMFARNKDGAGFAIQGDLRGDGVYRVHYEKGFMNADDLIEALGPKERLKDFNVAIHCRIKTHGETDQATTHPFPMTTEYYKMRQLSGDGAVLFHNGVFTGLGGTINENASDTQDYVAGVAMRYLSKPRTPSKICQKIVEVVTGTCRVLILYPNKKHPITMLGTWYEHEGCMYSNMGYRTTYTPTTSFYDDDDYKYRSYPTAYAKRTIDLDEWGCNVAPYAWPSATQSWIRFSDERWKKILEWAKDIHEKDGYVVAKFGAYNEEWIIDEAEKQIYKATRIKDVELRRDEDEYAEELFCVSLSSEIIYFSDEDNLIDFEMLGMKLSPFKYKFKGKTWYVDTVELEAFTEKGLAEAFGAGQQGHARKDLETQGRLLKYYKRFDEWITDQEEDEDLNKLPMLQEGLA